MKQFLRDLEDWLCYEPFRALNRAISWRLTLGSAGKDVRKLKNVEVCGDTIAWIMRG